MEPPRYLRDLLYLDTEKAASIFSQLYGGLVRETHEASEHGRERRRGFAFDLGLLKPEFGGGTTEKTSVIESRVLHHDLLLQLEDALFDLGMAVDLTPDSSGGVASAEEVRNLLQPSSYVRAEGWVSIEDYDRIQRIAGEFPALLEFIQRCAASGVEQSEELQELRRQLDEQRQRAIGQPNKQARQHALRQVSNLEKQFTSALKEATRPEAPPEQWLIEGIQKWIDVFLPGRITLRLFPFDEVPNFQVVANLKRESFVDADLGNLLFAYGPQPNVRLTVLGLITSFPQADGPPFDLMREFQLVPDGEGSEEFEFERGFRGLFAGMDGLEKFSRFSRYPNITVYPLALYRRVPVAEQPA